MNFTEIFLKILSILIFVWVIVLLITNAWLPFLWAEHTRANTTYSNSMDNNRFIESLTWAPKGFDSPISPVLLPAEHTACFLDLLCFMQMDFLSGCLMILATPTCWDLQCFLDFTFTASHSTYFQRKMGIRLHDNLNLVSLMSAEQGSHWADCQGLQSAGEEPWPSWTAVASTFIR